MLTLTLVAGVVVVLCIVLKGDDEQEEIEDGEDWTPIKSHGKGLKAHGKGLQSQVAGGRTCPHCGKPI